MTDGAARRLFLLIALVTTVSSFWLMYVYWSIGTRLEAELVSCWGAP